MLYHEKVLFAVHIHMHYAGYPKSTGTRRYIWNGLKYQYYNTSNRT